MRLKGIDMKKKMGMCLLVCAGICLTACGGPSVEEIQEVQEMYAQLVSSHNEAVEAYANLEDDSLSKELDEMAVEIESMGKQDTQNMTQEELDAIETQLQEHLTKYEEMQTSIQELETAAQTPTEDMLAIPVTFKNNTGVDLYQLYFYKASDTEKGDNLVEDIDYLASYQTRNILNLYMEEEEQLWILEGIDEEGNTIQYAEIDFTGYGEEGVTIVMEYSFDTMEGWIEME